LWYSGDASAAAGRLAAACPVTLIQPLPNRLWRRTGLRPRLATVKGAPRGVEAFHLARTGVEHGVPAVPIIEADESWLGTWAAWASGRRVTARFAVLGPRRAAGSPPGSPDLVGPAAGVGPGLGLWGGVAGSPPGFLDLVGPVAGVGPGLGLWGGVASRGRAGSGPPDARPEPP